MSTFRWGGDEFMDDVTLILNNLGKRCASCNNVTKNHFLNEDKCPDCSGTTPLGRKEFFGTNGGVQCDRSSGPCSCGAWH